MYFDTSYIAKFYLPENESADVEALLSDSFPVRSSFLALTEFHSILHRKFNEGVLTEPQVRHLSTLFLQNIADGLWKLIPVGELLLRRTAALTVQAPFGLSIRSADAVHLLTARESGETEIWTSDRHMLAAAPYFGLVGHTVQS